METYSVPSIQPVVSYMTGLQKRIAEAIELADGAATMLHDTWKHSHGSGYGTTSILEHGAVFGRAGIGFSNVTGNSLPAAATAKRPKLAGLPYQVTGVSLVFHPNNPYVPTVHMNVRCFMVYPENDHPVWWFGGGMDLTPYYGFEEDAVHFHQSCKKALDPFGKWRYPEYKKACDQYFFLKHRKEPRGIGGIFYDDVNDTDFSTLLELTQSVGDHFLGAYLPIIERRKNTPYGEREKAFQAYRRGRYVEFNLTHDRGTIFGLQSNGRTESILLSMPPEASWRYQYSPEKGSPEERLTSEFLTERDWLSLQSESIPSL
jgi:coproporphyrinogen III oxidase